LSEEKQLLAEKQRLENKLAHPDLTLTDRAIITMEMGTANNKLLELHKAERERKEKRLIEQLKSNPKAFYKYANKKKKVKEKIGPLKPENSDEYIKEPEKIAQMMASQYKSVFQPPCLDTSNIIFPTQNCTPLEDIDITPEKVKEAAKQICLSSASGPDGIPPIVYHDYIEELAEPIARIWRTSLDLTKLPEGKAQSVITPIFKEGVKSHPANYRPVSLTNHLTKIFERILRTEIADHLEKNNLFNR